jgi:hypothetical protein
MRLPKIKKSDLKNAKMFLHRGGKRFFELYEAEYCGNSVIVKVETLEHRESKTGDRFEQEKKIFELNLPHVVKCFGCGYDWDGWLRFFVMEKLYGLGRFGISKDDIIEPVIYGAYDVYRHGGVWAPNKKHVLADKEGNVKIIDFNDDVIDRVSFFDNSYYSVFGALKNMFFCDRRKIEVITKKFLRERYAALKNVHQPIYIDGLGGGT